MCRGVDIRVTRTIPMVTDLMGRQLVGVSSFPTEREPKRLVAELGKRIKKVLAEHEEVGDCKGVGRGRARDGRPQTRRIIHAPTLGWRDVEIRESLAAATGLPVHVENSGKACALAQMWATREDAAAVGDLVFVSVSDGIGVGVVVNGEVLRGPSQHRRGVRPRPSEHRRPALSVRRDGMLGGLHLQPGDALALLRPEPARVEAGPGGSRGLHGRRSNHQGAGRGRKSDRRARSDGALPGTRAGLDRQRGRPGAHIHRRRNSRGLGPDRTRGPGRVIRTRALAGRRQDRNSNRPLDEHPRLRGAATLVAAPAFAAPAVA